MPRHCACFRRPRNVPGAAEAGILGKVAVDAYAKTGDCSAPNQGLASADQAETSAWAAQTLVRSLHEQD